MTVRTVAPALLPLLVACAHVPDDESQDRAATLLHEADITASAAEEEPGDARAMRDDQNAEGGPLAEPVVDAGSVEPSLPAPVPLDPNTLVRANGKCAPLWQAETQNSAYESAPLDLSLKEALESTAAAMVGNWVGRAEAPSGWIPSRWPLTLTLRGDGSYDAESQDPQALAFYYGSDLPCELKRWKIDHVGLDGVGGNIDITFQYPPDACYLPGWQGKLQTIRLDAAHERLSFEFRTDDGYGPVVYQLFRLCE